MDDLKPCRPDIEIQSLCRELRQQGYLVPYTVMAKATQDVAISLAPTVQEAAKVLLDEPNALAELAKALIFWDHLTSFQRLRVGLHYTIDPTGKTVPKRYLASISEEPQ